MKLKLRDPMSMFALAVTLTLFCVPTFAGALQSQERMQQSRGAGEDRDHDWRNIRNPNYERGRADGQDDSAKNRDRRYRPPTNNDADRRAYEAGYNEGYQENRRSGYNHDGNRNDDDRNGRRDENARQDDNTAGRMGSQDGFNDGRQDRLTGHSNRPMQGDNYKDATRGFAGGAGETAYKAAYRRSYVPAYQRGYSQQNAGRR